jgi:PTH1 family peptidyl-tRNA hydrolase
VILVVGLGNPGTKYAGTRHNIGFMVVERFVTACGGQWREKFNARLSQVELGTERLVVLEPQTYMNESGRSVQPAAAFFKVAPPSVLVVHDELDLPFGDIRLKEGGGDAGHRGLKSITAHLGTPGYVRLRVGIDRPPPDFRGSQADYVLQAFASAERAGLDDLIDRAVGAVRLVVERGVAAAMNVTNQRPKR